MIIPRIYTGLKSHSDSAVARLTIYRCAIGEPYFCCWIFFSHHNTASTFQLACQMLLKADHLLCNGLKATLRYLLRGDVEQSCGWYKWFIINIKEIWANREKSHETKTIKRSCCVNAEGWEVLSREMCWHLKCMHAQAPDSFIPPTLRLILDLTPQWYRAWPQTSYWLLTMVEWSVHNATLIHYVQKTQQRKTVVWECLEVCGQQRLSAASFRNLSSSHPLWLLTAYPKNTETVKRRPRLKCVECLGLSWAGINATFPLSCVTGCGRSLDDEVMEMLGGHSHCDAGWLLLWNCHLPKRSVARGRFSRTVSASQLSAIHTPTNTHTHIHTLVWVCTKLTHIHTLTLF